MRVLREVLETPVKDKFDVVVSGGGVAGIAAALSCAREGMRTLLLEKGLTLGGLATVGLINYFVPMCNGHGKQIITGMAEELLRLSVSMGYDTLPDAWKNGEPETPCSVRYTTKYSQNIFAMQSAQLLRQEGVTILLDTVCVATDVENGAIRSVIVENKGGRFAYDCAFLIDATGDGDLLHRSGVPCVTGKNYYTYIAQAIDLESCKRALETGNIRDAFTCVSGGVSDLYGGGHPENMPLWEGVTAEDVTEYVLSNQKIVLENLEKTERNSREVTMLPGVPQMRTTRHIDGEYTLREEDAYKRFEDSIGLICDFDRADYLYEVPLRTLMHRDFTNILTCGRSASAEGYAWDVLRVIPPAILTGQAAGIAASTNIKARKALRETDIALVQRKLADSGVLIHCGE